MLAIEANASSDTESSPDEVQNMAGKPAEHLSASQVMQYASAAGFDDSNIIDAVAIAMAESRGNVNAYNPEIAAGTPTGLGSVGLWQIYQKAHPEFAELDLTDPQVNADAAFLVYQRAGNSFHPWTTYSGLWRDRLGNDASGNPKWSPVTKHPAPYLNYVETAQLAYDSMAVQAADNASVADATGDSSGE